MNWRRAGPCRRSCERRRTINVDRVHPNGRADKRRYEDSAYRPCRRDHARARRGRSIAISTAAGDDPGGHLARYLGVPGAPLGLQRRNRRLSDSTYERRGQPDGGRAKDRTRRGTGDGVLTCRFASTNGPLTCVMPQGTWQFRVRNDSLVGELRLADNTKFRDVRTVRAR